MGLKQKVPGPGYAEIAYDPARHAPRCHCRVDLLTLDGGAPAVSVFKDEVTGEISCSQLCAIDVIASNRCVVLVSEAA